MRPERREEATARHGGSLPYFYERHESGWRALTRGLDAFRLGFGTRQLDAGLGLALAGLWALGIVTLLGLYAV